MGPTDNETGRFRQRRRTCAAIVAATMDLLKAGESPSIAEIAEAADVSRRTVYLHFPTLEQLLIDATVGLIGQSAVDDAIEAADAGDDVDDVDGRVAAMIAALGEMASETLPLGRSLIRLTVDSPPPAEAGVPRRGYRRVAWIEKAIGPLRGQVDDADFERLVSGLAMVIGWEALIVLEDLRGLAPDQQVATSLWAARALIAATLERPLSP